MVQETTSRASPSRPIWERLEAYVREQVQQRIRALLEEEIPALLGQPQSARRGSVDAPKGWRHGDGQPRRRGWRLGTLTVCWPRVRGPGGRMVSRVLPLFKRRGREVGELLPQLPLHGSARGDCELAPRRLLGESAPLSATSLARLKANWPLGSEARKPRRLDDPEGVYVWVDGPYVNAGLDRRYRWGARKPWNAWRTVGRGGSPATDPRVNIGVIRGPPTSSSLPLRPRRRTTAAKRFREVYSATAIIWKLLRVAEQTCRRLNAPAVLPAV